MSELNNPKCVVLKGSNTGLPDCTFAPEKFVGAILVDRATVISDADAEDIITALQELTVAEGKTRAFPIFRFEEITDNSEDVTIQTLGYGSKTIVKDGKYDWSFRMIQGGMCLNNKLRSFNKMNKKVLFVDSNNVIYGTEATGGVAGFSMDFFYASPFKAADGTNTAIFMVRFALSKPEEFNEKVVFIKTSVDVEESVKGLVDLELHLIAVVAGKATVGIRTDCDKVDVYETFDDLIANADLWAVTKDGATVAITSVVKNDAVNGWDVSFTGTGEHAITLAPVADLITAEVGGYPESSYEGGVLVVTMPAAS